MLVLPMSIANSMDLNINSPVESRRRQSLCATRPDCLRSAKRHPYRCPELDLQGADRAAPRAPLYRASRNELPNAARGHQSQTLQALHSIALGLESIGLKNFHGLSISQSILRSRSHVRGSLPASIRRDN